MPKCETLEKTSLAEQSFGWNSREKKEFIIFGRSGNSSGGLQGHNEVMQGEN